MPQILGDYPNTYTFTKSMAEKTLKKIIPNNLPVVLLRPSIVVASIRDPYPGWTDTLSAAGGLGVGGGVGLVKYVHSDEKNIADIIPVDFVSHATILSTALHSKG